MSIKIYFVSAGLDVNEPYGFPRIPSAEILAPAEAVKVIVPRFFPDPGNRSGMTNDVWFLGGRMSEPKSTTAPASSVTVAVTIWVAAVGFVTAIPVANPPLLSKGISTTLVSRASSGTRASSSLGPGYRYRNTENPVTGPDESNSAHPDNAVPLISPSLCSTTIPPAGIEASMLAAR